jgi:hypothetical protein
MFLALEIGGVEFATRCRYESVCQRIELVAIGITEPKFFVRLIDWFVFENVFLAVNHPLQAAVVPSEQVQRGVYNRLRSYESEVLAGVGELGVLIRKVRFLRLKH